MPDALEGGYANLQPLREVFGDPRPSFEPDFYDGVLDMGSIIDDELGDKTYVVGFTSYEGQWRLPFSEFYDVPQSEPNSIDWLFAQAGFERAFLDVSQLAEGEEWLRSSLMGRFMGHYYMEAQWPEIFDGLFFIREMNPSFQSGR